jgi:hypothetical protein
MCSFDNRQSDELIDFDARDVADLLNDESHTCHRCTPGTPGSGDTYCPKIAEQAGKAVDSIVANIAANLKGRRY